MTKFSEGGSGYGPVIGRIEKFQIDSDWQDPLLFHEYFHGAMGHGCMGAGFGANHQLGTGTVAPLLVLGDALHSGPAATAGVAN